jgi:hypothetical protein
MQVLQQADLAFPMNDARAQAWVARLWQVISALAGLRKKTMTVASGAYSLEMLFIKEAGGS